MIKLLDILSEAKLTISGTDKAIKMLKSELRNNNVDFEIEGNKVIVNDSPKAKMAVKMVKERVGMQSIKLAEEIKSEATFTKKYDDSPKLKGKQTELPDELQAQLVKKEAATPLADLYDLIEKLIAQGVSKDEILRIVNFATAAKLNENQDHEVAMAQASLEAIAKAAIELSQKIGGIERNIPGWIQDHITNAENYIEQAAQGFHELKDDE